MTVADDLATLLHYGYIAAGVVVRRRNEVRDAHDRVEAEIARLENLVYELRGNLRAAEEQIADSEAEVARLRDGLRGEVSSLNTMLIGWIDTPPRDAVRPIQAHRDRLRALLAEDGAACGHEVWKHGVCELCGAKVDK